MAFIQTEFVPKTIDEIYSQKLLDKQTLTSLNALVDNGITDEQSLIAALNAGDGSDWILWLYNDSVTSHESELHTLSAVNDINELFAAKTVGTPRWYVEEALKFQLGYTYSENVITHQLEYAEIDVDAQIIGSSTILEVGNEVFMKVRRKDTDIFNAGEQVQFESYMKALKEGGTQINVENFTADEFSLNMTIIYDGTQDLNDVKSQVESTILSYLNNIEFDSKFITSKMIDQLQLLTVVIDPRFDSGSVINSLSEDEPFTHEYITTSGYGKINPLFPLSTTINYIPRTK